MGQARQRGTREQRMAEAQAAGRRPGAPERTKPYRRFVKLSTPMIDYLERQYKVLGDLTVGELRADVARQRRELQAARERAVAQAAQSAAGVAS